MRKINSLVIIVLIIASVCALYERALAQQSISSATLSGRLEDVNGAAISGAKVTATNLDQNQSSTGGSDAQGRFRFLYLPVGRYRLEVRAAGFAPVEQRLTLTVGQALDVTLKLRVGNVTEKVNVTASAPLVETVRTQVAETVLPQEIDSLPLNSRNYLDLAALTPGVTLANPSARKSSVNSRS
jgi:hypothetical protein